MPGAHRCTLLFMSKFVEFKIITMRRKEHGYFDEYVHEYVHEHVL
jgi:hypothetical protein